MTKLSLALTTYNEEDNIEDCIMSCKGLVDEIVVVDGGSNDRTGELALKAGARVIRTQNEVMFHINKQKAMDACTGDWILQLDADERVTQELSDEIKRIMLMSDEMITKYQKSLPEIKLFERHQTIVQKDWRRAEGNYNSFFIPRLNYFLGGYLRSGGVYPDGVIRLIRKGKAHLPCKDVHELMVVKGKTGWLEHPLIHRDSPTFKRYLERNSRYIDHLVEELSCIVKRATQNAQNKTNVPRYTLHISLLFDYVIIKPTTTFFSLLIRHKGVRDGWRGVVFAFFSAIRFPRAYYRFVRR